MTYVLTPAQMRDADAREIARSGREELMRRAGAQVARVAARYARTGPIVAFAGPGNNGGDAEIALAQLASTHECVLYRAGAMPSDPHAALRGCGLAIDALFGTGARLPLPDWCAPLVAALNACEAPVLSVDIPSGVDALHGTVSTIAVRASVTVALGALKPGLLLDPAREYAGELWRASIGIGNDVFDAQPRDYAALDDAEFVRLLPQRAANSDKRSAGAPLVIAGSVQFPGAAVLCARGAARAGAGYVTVATSAAAAAPLRAHLVEQVVLALDDARPAGEIVDELLDACRHASSVAIGPGLGLDDRTGAIVRGFAERCDLPLVADASALFHFAKHLDVLRGKRCVLTPHAGEFARLSGKGTLSEEQRVKRLREFVARTGVTTLLKGRTTLVDDGATMRLNTTGTNALATAGSGDVLTGIIATLLSQGLSPVDAARAGAYWHGLAGQYCARERPVGVVAGDLPDALAASLPPAPAQSDLIRIF